MYTIKQAAARTGVSVPVLRAWERRYGVVAPIRTAAGYRLYDDGAITTLQAMRALVDSGWSPSAAAAAIVAGTAPDADLGNPVAADTVASDVDSQGDRVPVGGLRSAFVDHAAALDTEGIEQVLDEMFAGGSFEVVVERDVLPALRELGEAWAAGRVGVAGEHAASHAVGRRLGAALQAAGRPGPSDGAILVGLPPGARHELGALAFAVAARRAGLAVLYLGPDLPIEDWASTARRVRSPAAVIGAVTAADGAAALRVARELATTRPEMVLAFGGRGAPELGPAETWPGPMPVVLPDRLGPSVDLVAAGIARASA